MYVGIIPGNLWLPFDDSNRPQARDFSAQAGTSYDADDIFDILVRLGNLFL